MKLTIFGATGGVGGQLVRQAAAAGHEVTAVVRGQRTVSVAARVVTADVGSGDVAALERSLRDADAVLSGLGPRSRSDVGIASRATRSIVAAMQAVGVRRIVVISAAPVAAVPSPGRPGPLPPDPGDGALMRTVLSPMTRRVFRQQYADLALMEDCLRDSMHNWTVVRPPRLTDKPLTMTYRTAYGRNVRRGMTISRADAAHCMLATLTDPEAVKQTIGLAY